MTPPRLSIVIPCHQRIDLLALCLQSLTSFAPPDAEILVVDDASPQQKVSQLVSQFPSVRSLRIDKQSGFAVAANQGIEATSGEIIELLNDDTQVTQNWFAAPLRAFTDPKVGAVAPLVLQGPFGEQIPRVDSAGDEYDLGGYARKRGHGQPLRDEFRTRKWVFGASASSGFYRRSALEKVGLFPTEFGAYFEDVDLSFRLQNAGYRILFEPDSQVWHRCGSSYRQANRRVIEMQSRNEERVFWRNLSVPQLRKNLPRHLAVLGGKAIRRWREGTFLPFLLGRLRLFGEMRAIVRHRWRAE